MKKLLSLLFVMVLGLCLASCGGNQNDSGNNPDDENKDRPTLTVGMECAYAPFNWTEAIKSDSNYPIDGTNLYAEGYDVQIAKKIADELGYRLVVKAIEWDGLIPALESGQIDAIVAGMSDTEERRVSVDFTAAYYRSTHVLVMNKTSKYVNGKTLSDFEGANVVGQIDTLYDSLIDQLSNANHLTPLEDVPTIITSITAKRADITILEEPVAKGVVGTNPLLTYIKLEQGFTVSEEDVCVAIAIRKGDTELNEKVSNALNQITQEQRTQLMDEAIERNAQ